METIITSIPFYTFCVAWFITHFDPIVVLLEKHLPKLDFLQCFKCVSFWITLICTFDIFIAIFVSLIANLYDAIESR